MNKEIENPSAYPVVTPSPNEWHSEAGMSLRDYFAAHAPTTIVDAEVFSCSEAADFLGMEVNEYNPQVHYPKLAAALAYQYADALLETRQTNS